ncbi:SGNH/GDSL hydrolase family protein [Paraburkholderia tropica]|uniref:SGNH/GDSL hydrolase family protein n=1 Tax=Paraburkholderia tropica TaxID=92647 RepID=UPI003D2E73C3
MTHVSLRTILVAAACGALALGGILLLKAAVNAQHSAGAANGSSASAGRVNFAVLGDSDSQSYYDGQRGGSWRATTWQWTEVLARLRGDQIDFGKWGVWGSNKYEAYVADRLGLAARSPRKTDYRYNFAVSGASCEQLMGGSQRQARRLVALMDTSPRAWRNAIVLIRIGVNDIGQHDVLDALAHDRNAARPAALTDACLAAIGDAVGLIRNHHPQTRIVLVGVLSNADWSVEFDHWQSAAQIANIDAALDRFDDGLRKLAATHANATFLDDRAWFRSLWGERDGHGRPVYNTVRLAPGWAVTNTSGDDPHNAVLSDGHAGVVWNALWAQHLVNTLDTVFGLHIQPITDLEVIGFLQPGFANATRAAALDATGGKSESASPLPSSMNP